MTTTTNNEVNLSQASTLPIDEELINENVINSEEVISDYMRISQQKEDTNSALCSNSPTRKRHLNDEFDDDGMVCPICLDNWTNIGDHRVCSLKCGHLFGLSCINRWLMTETKKCPTCKTKVSKQDIRHIYAKKLIAVDSTELNLIKQQLESTTQEKNKIQLELTRTLVREHLLLQELDLCKKKIQILNAKLEIQELQGYSNSQMSVNKNSSNDVVRIYKDKTVELSKDGGCRVLDTKSSIDLVVASMKSPNNFFTGYGIRKICISSYKPVGFIGLHKMAIRDIKFHSQKSWVLSVSLDKIIKITDVNASNSVMTFGNNCPLWSCCWDADNENVLYIGEQQGCIKKYDIRQISEPVCVFSVPGDMSPVVSVAAIKPDVGSGFDRGGVIACKLNSIWTFENTTCDYSRYPLPIEGPFVSMSYQNHTNQLLVSSRPNSKYNHARHILCNISIQNCNMKCDVIHTFQGGSTQTLLSRSCLLSNKSDFVAAYHENQNCVNLWNINTGRRVTAVPMHDPVLDLSSVQTTSANFLLTLTEKKLEFFQFY